MTTIVTSPAKPTGRDPLTRERVLTAALTIVDQDGLAKLSMRRLGAELGVDPMAVYYYVPSKAALLDGIVDAVIAELGPVPPREDEQDLTAWIVSVFTLFWKGMVAHPNALPLMDTRPISGEAGMAAGEMILTEIEREGVAPDVAVQTLMLLTTISIAIAQTSHARAMVFDHPDAMEAYMAACASADGKVYPRMQAGFMSGQTKNWQSTLDFTLRALMARVLSGGRPDAEPPATCS